MSKNPEAHRPAAVLVGVQLSDTSNEEHESSLAELARLVETLGFEVIGTLTQKRASLSPATLIGEGKLKELAAWTGGSGQVKAGQKGEKDEAAPIPAPPRKATKVVFDHELTPNQLRNLTNATGCEVLDRTGVIVEIFHRHAKTKEARLQVEIARLNYLAPRMRATGPTERQGGGVGSKGVGETAHELDRRRIRDRVAELTRELEAIHGDQNQRRARRSDQSLVALVGYTNAGKSSLMRALTGSEVLVADKLFATLDTTVRVMQPDEYPRVLVSDTVGFIKKLPHDLVASFRSTLDEARDASLLLYVVDASDPTFRSQLEVTREVLKEIDASAIPSLLILNKRDRLDEVQKHMLAREFPDAVFLSTRERTDIDALKQRLRDFFMQNMEDALITVPYGQTGLLGEIRQYATVLEEKYDELGIHFKIRTSREALARLRAVLKKVG